MEKFGQLHTAQDLFEFLSTIPPSQRERLHLQVLTEEGDVDLVACVHAYAYETTETEGCIERGLQLTGPA